MKPKAKPAAKAAAFAPSMAEAAQFLRELGKMLPLYHEWPEGKRARKDEQLRQGLGLIADCIEKKTRWRKGSALTMSQQDLIRAIAKWAPKPGMSLTVHLDDLATDIAHQWGWRGPDDVERVRGLIIEARKALNRQRKRSQGK